VKASKKQSTNLEASSNMSPNQTILSPNKTNVEGSVNEEVKDGMSSDSENEGDTN